MRPFLIHRKQSSKLRMVWVVLLCALMFMGCKERLFSNLEEKEINEMLAILLQNDISSQKEPGDELMWHLYVDTSEIANAIRILKSHGFPKEKYQSIGDVFKKEGLVSSPLEERVRFIYALSQEVAETISRIDGVLDARVHIVLPENDPLSDTLLPSSASVFIKHRADADIESSIIKIKDLVVNSIEGLEFNKVSLALFPADVTAEEHQFVNILGVVMLSSSVSLFRWIIITFVLLLVGSIGSTLYFYYKSGKTNPGAAQTVFFNRKDE